MPQGERILDKCDPGFARSWSDPESARPLIGGFVDAMAVVSYNDGRAHIELKGPGFTDVFGEGDEGEPENFVIRADRQDREALIRICEAANDGEAPLHADIAWTAGWNRHAPDDDNFVKTITSVTKVGESEGAKLLYFAFRDVSARRTAEQSLSRSRFSSALRALFGEIFLLNLDTGESEPVYLGGRSLTGANGEPVDCGFHAMFRTVHRDDSQMFWKFSNYTYVENELFGDDAKDAITFDLRRSDEAGEYHWTRIYISRVADVGTRKSVLVCSQNIDEQKDAQRRERELRSQAQTDALTGIYNHGTSEELIRARLRSLSEGDSAMFAIIDVDDFKRVNDTYGHSTGDELLKVVSTAVKGICRGDDIVGRMGGDEFVALLAGGDLPQEGDMRARFEHCKKQVRIDSAALGIDPPITLSIGVVAASSSDNDYSTVFDRADRLLYEVKRSGKDNLRFA